jgi:hypothetical protein
VPVWLEEAGMAGTAGGLALLAAVAETEVAAAVSAAACPLAAMQFKSSGSSKKAPKRIYRKNFAEFWYAGVIKDTSPQQIERIS